MIQRLRTWRRPGPSGSLYQGDALEFLRSLPTASADLIFLDPPFNLGKTYSAQHPDLDSRSQEDYAAWLSDVTLETVRVLIPGGALYIYHLPKWALVIGANLQPRLSLRHWIAIAMKNGWARGKRLYPAHYALLYFTKGEPAHFHRPKLTPKRCRHCGALTKDYGGYTKIIKQKGINLSDVWDDLSPVRHRANKHRAANELPQRITDRIMEISGSDGGMFVDPFAGSGASLLSAVQHGMRFRACDLLEANCELIANRIGTYKSTARRTGK